MNVAHSLLYEKGMGMIRRRRLLVPALIAVLAGGSFLIASFLPPSRSVGPCRLVGQPARLPELSETSGLAVSRRTPGVTWSHNDSGNAPVLFAVDADGSVIGRMPVPVAMRDWEDISAGECPAGECLYFADIGDNQRRRSRIDIYRVKEPFPGDGETNPVEVFRSKYADGPHNAEALFVVGADVFIITRDRTGAVYQAHLTSSGSQELTFERVGELGLEAVTDAETSRDGRLVVVRTSDEVVFYRTDDVRRSVFAPALQFSIAGLRESQGEGVALDGTALFLSSEGRLWNRAGQMIRLQCDLSGVS